VSGLSTLNQSENSIRSDGSTASLEAQMEKEFKDIGGSSLRACNLVEYDQIDL
jgi:hypothetical protein